MTARRWKPDRILHIIEDTGRLLSRFDPETVREFCRRSEVRAEVDGMPSGQGDGAPRGGGESSPTETAVLSRLCPQCDGTGHPRVFAAPWRPGDGEPPYDTSKTCQACLGSGYRYFADPISESIDDAFGVIERSWKELRRADRQRQAVLHAGSAEKGRKSNLQEPCLVPACGYECTGIGDDRRKRGLCPQCFWHWRQWPKTSDPGADFQAFIVHRDAQVKQDKEKSA